MTNWGAFVPFMILFFIAMLVFLGVRWLSNWNVVKRGYWMLGGYGVILIISVIIYYFIPVSAEESQGIAHPGNLETFNEVISGADSVASIEGYLEEEWTFSYDADTLQIQFQGENDYALRIAVARTENETIDAAYYRTPLYFNGEAVEVSSIPVNLRINDDRLDIISQENMEEVNLSSFSKEFPMQQFNETETAPFGGGFGISVQWSEQLIYLQVPEDIEISTGASTHVEYLN